MRVVCLERSNYRGPSPLKLELREHRLMLKRLKFDKILMRAQWLNSSISGAWWRCGFPGNVHHWEAQREALV